MSDERHGYGWVTGFGAAIFFAGCTGDRALFAFTVAVSMVGCGVLLWLDDRRDTVARLARRDRAVERAARADLDRAASRCRVRDLPSVTPRSNPR